MNHQTPPMDDGLTGTVDDRRAAQLRTARRQRRCARLVRIDRSGAAAGVLICALGAGAAWLAGYDFATRGVDVALGAVLVLCIALLVACAASGD